MIAVELVYGRLYGSEVCVCVVERERNTNRSRRAA